MLDIVVCSKNRDLTKRSIKVVNNVITHYKFDCNIVMFDEVMRSSNRKIYIIDVDNSLDVVYKIRDDDYLSIIILISSHDKIDIDLLHKKLLFLDYVCFDGKYCLNLEKNINMGLKMLFKKDIFSFKYNHMIYRIPYENINYIEKEIGRKRCIIHTIEDDYYIVNSIEGINDKLDGMFIKSSQSCIINMMNVKYVDCIKNVIYFQNNDMTSLITDKVKKDICECMR